MHHTVPAPLNTKHGIALQHLSYTYPKAAMLVFIDMNFEIPAARA
jgi:hypothetical protein